MSEESQLFGVSIRGWIAVILVSTVCLMSMFKIKVEEPMYTLVVMAVSFYLGSKSTVMKPDSTISVSHESKTSKDVP